MADIKTNLRELSIIVGVYNILGLKKYCETPSSFINICKFALPNINQYSYNNISTLSSFDFEQKQIIKNGFQLAKEILIKFSIKEITEINWYGFDTQKDEPYDISINNLKFSLKEESFILENMGLYKLLNCYTGSTYKRRHIFHDYAKKEYELWFNITWKELSQYLITHNQKWTNVNVLKNNKSEILISSKNVELVFYKNNKCSSRALLPIDCSLSKYEELTNSEIREKVFAKFINICLDKNTAYNQAKKNCAIVASKKLVDELNNNLNYSVGLLRFLRIHSSEYYYAKTTSKTVEIYKVPSSSALGTEIIIESISPSVPSSQANIITKIKNTKTNKILTLRNECRFSHGQFNGTPEAKLYYENNCTLEAIYERI